jgi:hypothetical protein
MTPTGDTFPNHAIEKPDQRPPLLSIKVMIQVRCEAMEQILPANKPGDIRQGIFELESSRRLYVRSIPFTESSGHCFHLSVDSNRKRVALSLSCALLHRIRSFGTPGKIRTYDLLLRRQTLYPD